jgi:hypothetical protein
MADAAEAITHGFEMVFGENINRGVCWFHVKKCIDKKLDKIENKEKRTQIIADIIALQVINFNSNVL